MARPRQPLYHPPAALAGFTLVELLLVVAVLSAVSLLAFGVMADDRLQLRHDDTRARLQAVYRALLGGPVTSENIGAQGFVADNGALPSDMATLLQRGTLESYGAKSPIFAPRPNDSSCANENSAHDITLVSANAQLLKGHRGNYLGALPVNGTLRDGWGNVAASDDALNFGWQFNADTANGTLALASLGQDNAHGGSDYAADSGWSLASTDWRIPLAGWTVQVKNWRGADIAANALSLSLLVYVNQAGGGIWRRYATTALPCLGANGSSSGACAGTVSASFIDGCKPGTVAAGTGRIPQGRHLLVLTDNGADATPWTSDDVVGNGPTLTSATPIVAQVDAVAGRNLPAIVLEVR